MRRLLVVDTGVVCIATVAAVVLASPMGPVHVVTAGAVAASWTLILQWHGARDPRVVGDGPQEYQRVVYATLLLVGWVAVAALVLKLDVSRSYLLVLVVAGLLGLLLGRKACRVRLRHDRATGVDGITRVLVLGGTDAAAHIARNFGDPADVGLQVTGVLSAGERPVEADLVVGGRSIPVLGAGADLREALEVSRAGMLVVTDTERLGHDGLKELMWQLSGSDIELMIAPHVVDVSNARLHLTAVAAMPFLHVQEPTYAQADSWWKVVFDRVVAGGLVVVLSPVLLAVALAVRLSGPGPVLFVQERIGRDGVPFPVLKFRTMRDGTDAELETLLHETGRSLEPCAKIRQDPRVTPVGRFLRRFSVDELPQLLNVLSGQMSLVGPRPQRSFEVESYDEIAYRRLRVRPGMTGLWQVSGRNDLTWEDAVRLDTFYVENWSMTADIHILWRTLRAVLFYRGPS